MEEAAVERRTVEQAVGTWVSRPPSRLEPRERGRIGYRRNSTTVTMATGSSRMEVRRVWRMWIEIVNKHWPWTAGPACAAGLVMIREAESARIRIRCYGKCVLSLSWGRWRMEGSSETHQDASDLGVAVVAVVALVAAAADAASHRVQRASRSSRWPLRTVEPCCQASSQRQQPLPFPLLTWPRPRHSEDVDSAECLSADAGAAGAVGSRTDWTRGQPDLDRLSCPCPCPCPGDSCSSEQQLADP